MTEEQIAAEMDKRYDKFGREIDLEAFFKLKGDLLYKIVARHETIGKIVSTVWHGRNERDDEGQPLIFETRIFDWDGSDELWKKYSTQDEALEGHVAAVTQIRFEEK